MATNGTKSGGKDLHLGYWKIRGLAQPIRLLMAYCDLKWEETRYEMHEDAKAPGGWDISEWSSVKTKLDLDFPNLPWLKDGDLKLTENIAILRHIARKNNAKLAGSTPKEQALVDMLLGVIADYRNTIVTLCYKTPGDFKTNLDEWAKNVAPGFLTGLDTFMGKKDYLIGNLTIADFILYEVLDQSRTMMDTKSLGAYDSLEKFVAKFEALPAISAYMKTTEFIKRPINNKAAAFK